MAGTTGKYLYKPFERKFLIPDKEVLWKKIAIKKALKIIEKEKIDLIFTTIPPNSVSLIGEELNNITKLPWVCDIRDEWTTDLNRKTQISKMNPVRLEKEKEIERRVLNVSSHITIISNLAKNRLAEFNEFKREKITVISNGYDSDDFREFKYNLPVQGDKLKILYSGNLSTRSFTSFLIALRNLEESNKIDPSIIEINFITSSGSRRLKEINNSEILKFSPYIEHDELIKELSNYHILLLYVDPDEPTTITGKIFEYLAARRNIFAVVPKDGVAASIITKCKAGIISSSDNIKEIEENFLYVYQQWQENKLVYAGIEEEIIKYDRKALTEKLTEIFNYVVN